MDQGSQSSCPLLEACGLGKSFGFKRVLRSIDLAFHAGEIVAVLGINGAGKTTLLACLYGILGRTRGEVRVGGRRFDRSDLEMRRRLLFMPYDGLDFEDVDAIRNAAIFSEIWRGIDAWILPVLFAIAALLSGLAAIILAFHASLPTAAALLVMAATAAAALRLTLARLESPRQDLRPQ